MGGLGVANSQNTRNAFRRVRIENQLCPDGHDYGKWGEWSGRWIFKNRKKRDKVYVWYIRRRCRRCLKVETRLAETCAERESISKLILVPKNTEGEKKQ